MHYTFISSKKVDYNLLPVTLGNGSDLQTIQRSGNLDSNEMAVPFFIYLSAAYFDLMPHI